jgi:hypothetical protein
MPIKPISQSSSLNSTCNWMFTCFFQASTCFSQSWELGVLQDSRMFRAQQQGPKHLALRRSWCHWKGLETWISKMASHWSFRHLQPKLWAKERPGVKLVVWLPTTKSRESTRSRRALRECDMALETSLWGATTLVQTSSRSEVGARSYEVPKSRDSNRDSFKTTSGLHFGSPEKKWHLHATPAE